MKIFKNMTWDEKLELGFYASLLIVAIWLILTGFEIWK